MGNADLSKKIVILVHEHTEVFVVALPYRLDDSIGNVANFRNVITKVLLLSVRFPNNTSYKCPSCMVNASVTDDDCRLFLQSNGFHICRTIEPNQATVDTRSLVYSRGFAVKEVFRHEGELEDLLPAQFYPPRPRYGRNYCHGCRCLPAEARRDRNLTLHVHAKSGVFSANLFQGGFSRVLKRA